MGYYVQVTDDIMIATRDNDTKMCQILFGTVTDDSTGEIFVINIGWQKYDLDSDGNIVRDQEDLDWVEEWRGSDPETAKETVLALAKQFNAELASQQRQALGEARRALREFVEDEESMDTEGAGNFVEDLERELEELEYSTQSTEDYGFIATRTSQLKMYQLLFGMTFYDNTIHAIHVKWQHYNLDEHGNIVPEDENKDWVEEWSGRDATSAKEIVLNLAQHFNKEIAAEHREIRETAEIAGALDTLREASGIPSREERTSQPNRK